MIPAVLKKIILYSIPGTAVFLSAQFAVFSQEPKKDQMVFRQHKKNDVQQYLQNVSVRCSGGKVHINWTALLPVLKEDEFIYYSVERSKGGNNFECLELRQGKLPPGYIDEKPYPELSYYRIRVVIKLDGYTYYLEGKSFGVMNLPPNAPALAGTK